MLHADLIGPLNKKYGLVCIDHNSKFITGYIIDSKSKASETLIKTIQKLNSVLQYNNNKSICYLRTDNEFRTKQMEQFCDDKGINAEFSAPHSSYQNGSAENANRILKNKIRILMMDSGIPKYLWTYAFGHALFLLNYLPRNKDQQSPWEIFSGKSKNLKHILPFGCLIFYHNYKTDQKIFTQYKSGVFIGYDKTTKIAFIYDGISRKIVRSSAFQGLPSVFPLRKNWYEQDGGEISGRRLSSVDYSSSDNDDLSSSSHVGMHGGSFFSLDNDNPNDFPPGPSSSGSRSDTTPPTDKGDNPLSSVRPVARQATIETIPDTDAMDIDSDDDDGDVADTFFDTQDSLVPVTNNSSSTALVSNRKETPSTPAPYSPPPKTSSQPSQPQSQRLLESSSSHPLMIESPSSSTESALQLVTQELVKMNQQQVNNQDKLTTELINLNKYSHEQNNNLINHLTSFHVEQQDKVFSQFQNLMNTSQHMFDTQFASRPIYIPVETDLLHPDPSPPARIVGPKAPLSLPTRGDVSKDLIPKMKPGPLNRVPTVDHAASSSDSDDADMAVDTDNSPPLQKQLPAGPVRPAIQSRGHVGRDLIARSPPGPVVPSSSPVSDVNHDSRSPTPPSSGLSGPTSVYSQVDVRTPLKIPDVLAPYLRRNIKRHTSLPTPTYSSKRRVKEGSSLALSLHQPDGSSTVVGHQRSKIHHDVNNPERNAIPEALRTSKGEPVLSTTQLAGGKSSITSNQDTQEPMVIDDEAHLLVNNLKYTLPRTLAHALRTPQAKYWKEAAKEEYDSLVNNKVFKVVKKTSIPKNALIVKSRWVFNVKQEDENNERFKARIVAKGFTQERGINYIDKYAPVMRFETLRLVFSIAAMNKWSMKQLDAKNAFLNGKLDHKVYLEPPDGLSKNKDEVWKLERSLYGLKQSPRIWYLTIAKVLKDNGFENSIVDPCMFWKQGVLLVIYVDDILITGKNKEVIEKTADILKKHYLMKDIGKPRMFLGISVKELPDKEGYELSMKDSIERIKENYKITPTQRRLITPLVKGFDKKQDTSAKLNEADHKKYRSIIGSLLYMANTVRLDISFAISYLSRFLEEPTEYLLKGCLRVMQYVIQTKHFNLKFTHNKRTLTYKDFRYIDKTEEVILHDYPELTKYQLTVVSDSDWAGDVKDRKSQSGHIVMLNGNIIDWTSRKQESTAGSSTESEYIALNDAVKSGKSILNMLQQMKIKVSYIDLVGDNCSALTLAAHNTLHKRTKHIDIKYHYIRELVENKTIKLNYINTKENIADILTKFDDTTTFTNLLKIIN